MKSIKKESGGDMEVLLSSDSVLAVNPRVTFRWSNKSAEADNKSRPTGGTGAGGGAAADESVGLPTLKPEERTLLALADGRRSIESLAKLAGMTTPVAVRHLRALYDRGILVTTDKNGAPEVGAAGLRWSADASGASPVKEAVASAPVEYDTGATSAAPAGGGEVEAIGTGGGSGVTSGSASAAVATTIPNAVSVSGAAASSSGPVSSDKSGPSAAGSAAAAAARKHPSGPNVTLFWTPANADSSPVGEGKMESNVDPLKAFEASTAPRPRRNSPEPTVIIGSTSDSGATAAPKTDAAPAPAAKPSSEATIIVVGTPAGGSPIRSDPAPAAPERTEATAVPSASQETPAPSVAIPFRVGQYEVATRIAQGAMGSIYVCRRVGAAGFQRLFTLKVIRQYSTQKEIAAKSFMREAQFGALLNHPNLQTLVDVGNYEDQPFLILDYIEGTSLLDLLADDRRPSAAIVVGVMMDLLRGLQHVHDVSDENGERLGLVHGDVSPHNILVGVDGVARLTDFGSARFSKRSDAPDSEPVAAGKPAYMAPEQLRGEATDARTDLFAVGVTMWTALTGQKLFTADSYDETVVRVMRRKIPPPSEFGAPPSLDAVVLRALSRSPEGRYSSADEMLRDLQAVATAEHLVAPGRDIGQWVRREVGEALADRKRKIQEAFGVPGARGDSSPSQAKRPHRPTPKTADGLERLPAKTVLLEAGEIQAALGAARSEAHRIAAARPRRPPQEASRSQWAVVIVSAVIAAFALTAAIIYLITSLNTQPKKPPAALGRPAAVSPSGSPLPSGAAPSGAAPSGVPPSGVPAGDSQAPR